MSSELIRRERHIEVYVAVAVVAHRKRIFGSFYSHIYYETRVKLLAVFAATLIQTCFLGLVDSMRGRKDGAIRKSSYLWRKLEIVYGVCKHLRTCDRDIVLER